MANKNVKTDEPQRAYKNLPDASVPFDSVFTGDIETKAGVRIDGNIKGNIAAAGNVIIGSDGSVEGTVTGKDINIAGNVNGNVNSFGTVQMLAGSKLVGDLQAVSVAIEQGAYLKGMCTITDKRKDNAHEYLGKLENKTQPKPAQTS
ncbi:MAG: polymer-forming cytoskeletal protein [Eubacteriales bacterium]|nr:polymer-forming cytoskeletal protein [Eubacteriales bacterium]